MAHRFLVCWQFIIEEEVAFMCKEILVRWEDEDISAEEALERRLCRMEAEMERVDNMLNSIYNLVAGWRYE